MNRKRKRNSAEQDDLQEDRQRKTIPMRSENVPQDPSVKQSDIPDWRALLCKLTGVETSTPDQGLIQRVETLTSLPVIPTVREYVPPPPIDPFYKVLHRSSCSRSAMQGTSLDHEPPYMPNEAWSNHLTGKSRVSNLELYIERNPGISFIMTRNYRCCGEDQRPIPGESPIPYKETLIIISQSLCSILSKVSCELILPDFSPMTETDNAHLWAFHGLRTLIEYLGKCDEEERKHLSLFLSYLKNEKGAEFAEVERQLSNKMISRNFLQYLFVRGKEPLIILREYG